MEQFHAQKGFQQCKKGTVEVHAAKQPVIFSSPRIPISSLFHLHLSITVCTLVIHQKTNLFMKRINVLIAGVILFASCNSASNETKETKDSAASAKKEEAFVPVDKATMEKACQVYGTPGAVHAMMKSWDGNWTYENTMWMHPDSPAMKSTGMCTNKTILNGLFQETVFKGAMPGMPFPFEGRGLMGYDNAKKVFINNWTDNMGSGMIRTEGPWDEATKSVTLKGKSINPINGKDCDWREVFKVIDDKTQTTEIYCPSPKDGKEYKMMEIKLTRGK
jgi:hypothetical protein